MGPVEYLDNQLEDSLPFPDWAATDNDPFVPLPLPEQVNLSEALINHIDDKGLDATANTILENESLREKLKELIFHESFASMKSSLTSSLLNARDKNVDRTYLLSLTPRLLCEELYANACPCFLLIVKGLLGLSNPEDVFSSQYLINTVAFFYSIIAKHANRLCTGFALQLTTAARDGGMREDTIKLLPCFVHPRTSQKYDKSCLASGWDDKRLACLKEEQDHFRKIHVAIKKLQRVDLSVEDRALGETELRKVINHQSC